MYKKNKSIVVIVFLIGLSIFSGIFTYKLVTEKTSKKLIVESKSEKNKVTNSVYIDDTEEIKQEELDIKKLFNGIENLYISNSKNSEKKIELKDKEKDIIVANFKALEKKKGTDAELKIEMLKSYEYEIDLVGENINIRFYDKDGYMIIQKENGENNTKNIYRLNIDELDKLIKVLEEFYFNKLLEGILYPLPDKMYLNAEDENSLYVMKKTEIEDMIHKFKIISIEEHKKYIGIPTIYPDYNITFKRDDYEFKFHFINKNVMIIDTPIEYIYYKYNSEIWDYISQKLPVQNNSKEDELKYLLKSDKIIVRDTKGIYDFEDSSYYNIEMARCINLCKYERIDDKEVIDEELRLSLEFIVNGNKKEVLIYDNYMIYENKKYYSKNINESIKGVLVVQ